MKNKQDEFLNPQNEGEEYFFHKGESDREQVGQSSNDLQDEGLKTLLKNLFDQTKKGAGNIYFNYVAPGAYQTVLLGADQKTMALLEHILKGKKCPASSKEEGAAMPDGVNPDPFQQAALVFLTGSFRAYLIDDYNEEIEHSLCNIMKVKDVNSFLNQVREIYIHYFIKYPDRYELFMKREILCSFISLVSAEVSGYKAEEGSGNRKGAGSAAGKMKNKMAPRKGSGFSEGNIRRKLSECLRNVDQLILKNQKVKRN